MGPWWALLPGEVRDGDARGLLLHLLTDAATAPQRFKLPLRGHSPSVCGDSARGLRALSPCPVPWTRAVSSFFWWYQMPLTLLAKGVPGLP